MKTHEAFPSPLHLQGIDRRNPENQHTAIHLDWPETFSDRAQMVIEYLDDTAFLFLYDGRYIVTDESLDLVEFGDGSSEAPYGFPRFEGDSLGEVEEWLEAVADDYDMDGDIRGWDEAKERYLLHVQSL